MVAVVPLKSRMAPAKMRTVARAPTPTRAISAPWRLMLDNGQDEGIKDLLHI